MRRLTLTFDNGPTPGITERVLDVLARHGVRSTFFVIGEKLAASPQARRCAERAHAEGHWIGNHTFTHSVPLGEIADEAAAVAEVTRTEAEIGGLACEPKLFRPYGRGGGIGPWLLSPAALGHLVRERYTLVLWNCIPRDWSDPDGWVERAIAEIEAEAWPLVVLHDIEGAALNGLDRFIREARSRGFDIAQQAPTDCVPLQRGSIVGDVSSILAAAARTRTGE